MINHVKYFGLYSFFISSEELNVIAFNATMKIWWYLCPHIKIICPRFRIITLFTF